MINLTDYGLMPGDHIRIWRSDKLVYHHGVVYPNNKIVHFQGSLSNKKASCIYVTGPKPFLGKSKMKKVKVVRRAKPGEWPRIRARIDQMRDTCSYDLFGWNCEHFATWATTGKARSTQAEVAGAIIGVGLAALFIGAVAAIADAAKENRERQVPPRWAR